MALLCSYVYFCGRLFFPLCLNIFISCQSFIFLIFAAWLNSFSFYLFLFSFFFLRGLNFFRIKTIQLIISGIR